jgi:DNA-directed RNA polymerase subunit RPC12/RpoP
MKMGAIHPKHKENAEKKLGKRLHCPYCQLLGMNRCDPTPAAGDNPSFRCRLCGLKIIITNPSVCYEH